MKPKHELPKELEIKLQAFLINPTPERAQEIGRDTDAFLRSIWSPVRYRWHRITRWFYGEIAVMEHYVRVFYHRWLEKHR